MTYYVDFGADGSSIRVPINTRVPSITKYREVSRYVIFDHEPPAMAQYKARTIIKRMMDGRFIKTKWPAPVIETVYGQYLTADEEKDLLVQIMQSTTWPISG